LYLSVRKNTDTTQVRIVDKVTLPGIIIGRYV
jgi:hypothetical protein